MINPADLWKLVAGAVGLIIVVCGFCLALSVLICAFLASCLRLIPAPFRKQRPGLVWLLLIPGFSVIWSFFVFPRVAESFRAYFTARKRTDVGDCGYGLSVALCIAPAAILLVWLAPLAGFVVPIATFVLLCLVLATFGSLRAQVAPRSAAGMAAQKRCRQCGHQAMPAAKFCPHCGAAFSVTAQQHSVTCPRCAGNHAAGAKFCRTCGKPLLVLAT